MEKDNQSTQEINSQAQNPLGIAPVGGLIAKFAIPAIISMLVSAMYNIVDQIFIANASYLGSYGNAANTVVFPLTVVALAIAVMIGDGCCAFVSMALGRDDCIWKYSCNPMINSLFQIPDHHFP